MLQAYTSTPSGVALTANIPINLVTNKIVKGCTASHTEGSNSIYLKKCGTYKVDFNGIFVSSGEATPITVQMYNGTAPVVDAKATANSASNTDYVNLSFSTLVDVPPSCRAVNNIGVISFVNVNADVMLLANVTVLKVR